ncbi:GGDEF domain-containing protein [Pseudoalteromonas sp. G4]|uniref:GGDEF domain-containing protein n=1 Tax=Pseudoalteromonas sp. G4 TaxID=2992761 RepID=UPI00237DD0E3|nr:GGDEF domain-containing protein [Pseudoalteromonas sp. G4]MDE3270461.1 GGDEF domain-containing protein [Pseudoalteromonas sp. G4]
MEPTPLSDVYTEQSEPLTLLKKLKLQTYFSLENNPLIELVSSNTHSVDFTHKRSEYIRGRLWIMCMFFAFSVPAFSFFDFLTLDYQHAEILLVARLTLSISLFIMAYRVKRSSSVSLIKHVIALSFFLPALFYFSIMFTFSSLQDVPLIFTMMPYLILAMIGLFPLTIRGGVILISLIFMPFMLVQVHFFQGDYWQLFNAVWLFILFAGISLWLQIAQLSMLMNLYRESTIDPLTKLINRRVMLRRIDMLKAHATRFSVVMFDLDRFKRINDTYGHLAGDKVLKVASNIIKKNLTRSDIVARYGGEEFVAILPSTSAIEAIKKAELIASSLKASKITMSNNEEITVTSSIGVTAYQQGEAIEALFKRVDDLLYDAKELGRDRVVSDIN